MITLLSITDSEAQNDTSLVCNNVNHSTTVNNDSITRATFGTTLSGNMHLRLASQLLHQLLFILAFHTFHVAATVRAVAFPRFLPRAHDIERYFAHMGAHQVQVDGQVVRFAAPFRGYFHPDGGQENGVGHREGGALACGCVT